jgi:hypothetical protein
MAFEGGYTWIALALMVSLFSTLLFRPERITRPLRFRLACALLALEFAVPGVALYALGYSAPMLGTDAVLARARSVVSVAVPLLLGLAFWLAITSMMPSHRNA